MKASINWSVQTFGWNVRGISGSELIYANSVHEGQPPRIILPKRSPYLKFYWRRVGHVVRLLRVKHPGTAPQPYLVQALLTEAPLFGFKVKVYR